MYMRIILFVVSLMWTSPLSAINFRCGAKQLHCLVYDFKLTTGDQVGFFDRVNQLVATGRVVSIQGVYREVKIIEMFDRIPSDARIRLLSGEEIKNLQKNFTIARRFSPRAIGVTAAATTLGILEGFHGQEFNLFLTQRLRGGFSFNVGSVYTSLAGKAISVDTQTELEAKVRGIGVVSDVFYEVLVHKLISFKGGFGLGVMSVDSEIPYPQATNFDYAIREGINLLGRMSGSASLNLVDWRFEIMLANSYIFHSHMTSLGVGIIRNL